MTPLYTLEDNFLPRRLPKRSRNSRMICDRWRHLAVFSSEPTNRLPVLAANMKIFSRVLIAFASLTSWRASGRHEASRIARPAAHGKSAYGRTRMAKLQINESWRYRGIGISAHRPSGGSNPRSRILRCNREPVAVSLTAKQNQTNLTRQYGIKKFHRPSFCHRTMVRCRYRQRANTSSNQCCAIATRRSATIC